MRRQKMSKKRSRKMFTKTAKRMHKRNEVGATRGGIRL